MHSAHYSEEQYVTLEIPSHFPAQWLREGCSHLHFGVVRLALTFYGCKGLPITSRIALLNTRFIEYQHACIVTIQKTFNTGTVFITLYPIFCMPLQDPHLLTALKVQIQTVGAPQVGTTFGNTLHHRVQNHAIDLTVPNETDEALLINIDIYSIAILCPYPPPPPPRQISLYKLLKLLPETWVKNYEERQQQNQQPVIGET